MTGYLEISALTKTFPAPSGKGESVVVKDFELSVARGEFVSLIGHSGCGKSTVLSIIAGLTDATGGTVRLDGRVVHGPGTDRGMVFQSACLLPWMTALENVLLGVEQAYPAKSRAERQDIAGHSLELVGLKHALSKRPSELSAGMRQRVGLARAFALSPQVLLLDEPFGMLDSITRTELQEVLVRLWLQDRKTAIMVTHDVDEALRLSDRVVTMTAGPASHVGAVLDVPFARPRHHATLAEDSRYERLRDRLIGILDGQTHLTPLSAA